MVSLLVFPLAVTLLPLSTGTLYTVRPDQRLTSTPIATVTFNRYSVRGFGRCVLTCKTTSDCASVNARWESVTSVLTCELLTVFLHGAPNNLTSAPGWSFIQEDPVYADSSWALAFRVTPGVGQNVWDTFHDDGRHDDALKMRGCVHVTSDLPCNSHFRSSILDHWTNIKKVRLRLYKGGSVVRELIFNGQGSTRLTWLEQSRVLNSSWTDILIKSPNYFSIEGMGEIYRRFYLSYLHDGCPADLGWLVVADYHTESSVYGQCVWELGTDPLPVIYYSPQDDACNWQAYNNAGTRATADYMMIHVTFTG